MDYTDHPEYDNLPEAVKHGISPKEYAFLPEALKRTLIEDECTPDEGDDWEPAL